HSQNLIEDEYHQCNDDDPPASLLDRLTILMSVIGITLAPLVGPAPSHPLGGVSILPSSP
ncbi:MAG: hypothetical protein ACREHG_10515, partial [Candidatus Saccharimonadales bacterium]